ncbi:hypothetical protein ACHAWX_000048 [Stephanocyclus meneghinianus]
MVIPAPIVHIKLLQFKSSWMFQAGASSLTLCGIPIVYCKKLKCLMQAYAVNILAWNNKIGPWQYFVGLHTWVIISRDRQAIHIALSVVKFMDFCKTNCWESTKQGSFH